MRLRLHSTRRPGRTTASAIGTSRAGSLSVVVSTSPEETTLGEWDDLVRLHPLADVAQLSAWTRIRKLAGYDAMYILVLDGGCLVGGTQIMVRRIRGLGMLGYVPYGPVVSPTIEEPNVVHDGIADALAQLGRRRFRLLAVQPPQGAERASEALLERGFRESDADVAPAASLHVDLSLDEAQLRANLSKRLRTWTNSWEQRGVVVRQGSEEDLPMLAQLLAETAEHQGFTPFGIDYLRTMYRELAPAGHLVLFVGEVAGRPVAMTVFTACGTVLKVRLLGLDRSDEGRRLNVPAAVYWAAMKWAKELGYRWFDFGGVLPASVPALLSGGRANLDGLSGPDRYKARLGGQVFRYPQPVEMISSPIVRAGYDLARRSAAGRHIVSWVKRRFRAGDGARIRSLGRSVRPGDASGGSQ
jgi:lipid II:glycine glycyltransferase (peptidoglycan interpeptide bridge formation enzyme)